MKNIYFTVFFGFFNFLSFGQPYHPLIRPNLTWDVMYGYGAAWCSLEGGAHYFFSGDTVIQGKQYEIIVGNPIVTANGNPVPYCPPFLINSNNSFVAGFIREDTLARKVFVFDQANNLDALLYDFTLAPGDTLNSVYATLGMNLTIDSIGTISLLNGELRRIFYLGPITNLLLTNNFFIEGIGGSEGLQNRLVSALGHWGVPSCIKENSVQIYGYECIGFVGFEENSDQKISRVFPNPAQDYIGVEVDNFNGKNYYLKDLSGRVVCMKLLTEKYTQIDVSNLTSGIYFYGITGQDQDSYGKIIVSR